MAIRRVPLKWLPRNGFDRFSFGFYGAAETSARTFAAFIRAGCRRRAGGRRSRPASVGGRPAGPACAAGAAELAAETARRRSNSSWLIAPRPYNERKWASWSLAVVDCPALPRPAIEQRDHRRDQKAPPDRIRRTTDPANRRRPRGTALCPVGIMPCLARAGRGSRGSRAPALAFRSCPLL